MPHHNHHRLRHPDGHGAAWWRPPHGWHVRHQCARALRVLAQRCSSLQHGAATALSTHQGRAVLSLLSGGAVGSMAAAAALPPPQDGHQQGAGSLSSTR